jgi:hypothetical protein
MNTVDIFIEGINITNVQIVFFLGIQIDNKLNWKKHIDYTANKVAKGIGILYKCRLYVKKKSLIDLYYAMIYPYLTYCLHVWGSTYKSNLAKLVILQKKAIRFISSVHPKEHTKQLFINLKIIEFRNLHTLQIGIFMYKYTKKELPSIFDTMCVKNENVYNYYTRQHNCFKLPIVKTDLRKMSMIYQGPCIWNDLQKTICLNCSVYTFKRKLKQYILQKQSNAN